MYLWKPKLLELSVLGTFGSNNSIMLNSSYLDINNVACGVPVSRA
jgi:hypothetical protein